MTEYDAKQYESNYPPGIEFHYWNSARNQIILDTLNRARNEGLWPGGDILEVGCGTGVVVGFLRSQGIACWGCDLGSPRHVTPGAEPYLFKGQDFADLPDSFRTGVTCLLLLDVLEHVQEPVAFLTSMMAAYPHAQTLLVTVPARQEVWSNYDEFFGHRCRYHPKMLASELENAGLRVKSLQYLYRALHPPAYLMRCLGLRRSVHLQPPGRPSLHRMIAWAFRQDARWLPRWLPGTSLLALARRA